MNEHLPTISSEQVYEAIREGTRQAMRDSLREGLTAPFGDAIVSVFEQELRAALRGLANGIGQDIAETLNNG